MVGINEKSGYLYVTGSKEERDKVLNLLRDIEGNYNLNWEEKQ